MNQILMTNLKSSRNQVNYKRLFKLQFSLSILILLVIIALIMFYINSLYKEQSISNKLISNYNIYRLYSNISQNDASDKASDAENVYTNSRLFGAIEIQKINIFYTIFSETTEELLKIAPCKFYGNSPTKNGNLCIAGHNYNNNMFFSNINLLKNDDKIFIYDNDGNKYIYYVFDIYEVRDSDLSPVFNYDQNSKELTLITCNNLNSNRIIVKARQN